MEKRDAEKQIDIPHFLKSKNIEVKTRRKFPGWTRKRKQLLKTASHATDVSMKGETVKGMGNKCANEEDVSQDIKSVPQKVTSETPGKVERVGRLIPRPLPCLSLAQGGAEKEGGFRCEDIASLGMTDETDSLRR